MHVHVHVIYVSVIMILNFVASSKIEEVQDLNEWCSEGRLIFFYLTSGGGLNDKSVAMIAKEKNFNCTLRYSVKPKNKLLLVLEFPDLKPNEGVCINEHNTTVSVSNLKDKKMCQYRAFNHIYSRLSEENISLIIDNEDEMSTIKITVTSVRDPQSPKCSNSNETECFIDGKIFCATQEVACDGHNNCGVPNCYDENKKKCKESTLTFGVVFFSLIMGIMSILLIISFGVTFLPKRKGVFVYEFDQTMPLFDSEGGIVSTEIEFQVLFPNNKIAE